MSCSTDLANLAKELLDDLPAGAWRCRRMPDNGSERSRHDAVHLAALLRSRIRMLRRHIVVSVVTTPNLAVLITSMEFPGSSWDAARRAATRERDIA